MSNEVEKFAARLNEALDDAGVPPKEKGRQTAVAKMFGVSQTAARKWLEAEGMPDTKRIPEMAHKLGVMGEWMLSGIGPKQADSGHGRSPAGAEPARPQCIPESVWAGLPPKARALIEDIVSKTSAGQLSEADLALLISTTDRLAEDK